MWGVTIQNEPMATQRWNRIYTAEEERDFLKHHLGPAMAEAGYGDKNMWCGTTTATRSRTGPTPSLKTLWPRRTLGERPSTGTRRDRRVAPNTTTSS